MVVKFEDICNDRASGGGAGTDQYPSSTSKATIVLYLSADSSVGVPSSGVAAVATVWAVQTKPSYSPRPAVTSRREAIASSGVFIEQHTNFLRSVSGGRSAGGKGPESK